MTNILNTLPRIRPATLHDLSRIEDAAKADGCGLLYPTHVVERKSEVVGFISLGVVPMVGMWLHSEKVHARDTLNVCAFIDDAMNLRNINTYAIPLHDGSKFTPYMESVGAVGGTKFNLYYKNATV